MELSQFVVDDPAALLARNLVLIPVNKRHKFLTEMLVHTAAGLVIIEGDKKAAEHVYALADAIATMKSV